MNLDHLVPYPQRVKQTRCTLPKPRAVRIRADEKVGATVTLLKKDLRPHVSPLGNPAMPMKMPFGPKWFQGIEWNMPNLLMAGVPGFESMATSFMKMTVKNHGIATIPELRELCIEAEVNLVACQMTVDLFGWKKEEFIPEVTEWAGAATYLTSAKGADITLFI